MKCPRPCSHLPLTCIWGDLITSAQPRHVAIHTLVYHIFVQGVQLSTCSKILLLPMALLRDGQRAPDKNATHLTVLVLLSGGSRTACSVNTLAILGHSGLWSVKKNNQHFGYSVYTKTLKDRVEQSKQT